VVLGPFKKGKFLGMGSSKHNKHNVTYDDGRTEKLLLRRNGNGGAAFVLLSDPAAAAAASPPGAPATADEEAEDDQKQPGPAGATAKFNGGSHSMREPMQFGDNRTASAGLKSGAEETQDGSYVGGAAAAAPAHVPPGDREAHEHFAAPIGAFLVGERSAAFRGIWDAMGIVENGPEHIHILECGTSAIKQEFEENGQIPDEDWRPDDGFGSDLARFEYIASRPARAWTQPNGKVQDDSHHGKDLSGFMRHRNVENAGLTVAHVLALRLYTSNSYGRINGPLRKRCTADNPASTRACATCGRSWTRLPGAHPFPATTFFISDGLKKLRTVASTLCEPGEQDDDMVTWRGMAAMRVPPEVLRNSGTELGCCSTSVSKQEAMRWATSKGVAPLLFKVKARTCACWGIDMAWLSMYPGEQERLFPPLTYLNFEAMKEEDGATVVTVVPMWPT
jgi:hypothetical protein